MPSPNPCRPPRSSGRVPRDQRFDRIHLDHVGPVQRLGQFARAQRPPALCASAWSGRYSSGESDTSTPSTLASIRCVSSVRLPNRDVLRRAGMVRVTDIDRDDDRWDD